jgi:hypothetical protein
MWLFSAGSEIFEGHDLAAVSENLADRAGGRRISKKCPLSLLLFRRGQGAFQILRLLSQEEDLRAFVRGK